MNQLSLPKPILIDGADTVVKLWAAKCAERGDATAHREKDFGIWQAYSWSDWYDRSQAIGMGLIEQIGRASCRERV